MDGKSKCDQEDRNSNIRFVRFSREYNYITEVRDLMSMDALKNEM